MSVPLISSCMLPRHIFGFFFFLTIPPPPSSTLFPYTTLFRSRSAAAAGAAESRETVYVFNVGSKDVTLIEDRKSTRLNSSHTVISYAVFCLKKKKKQIIIRHVREDHTKIRKIYSSE